MRDFWSHMDPIARRRLPCIVFIFFLSFGGNWLWSLIAGIPHPHYFDEFSYLLAGDTFAHGRLTNPTHPMWMHFETFFEIQQPTYMSMYPPGQGLFLALGQVLFGHPIYGVWLSCGLMCAAISWMLYAWLPPRWALIGGIVAVMQFGVFTYWSQSYWGGAVAALGGALVFGALPRILKYQRTTDALWLGLGCAIIANSRPLEGFLVAIPVGCLVLPWKNRDRHYLLKKIVSVPILLPLAVVLLVTVVGMGAYNKAITADAKLFPHVLRDHTSRSVPAFIFEPLPKAPRFDHPLLAAYDQHFPRKHYFYKRTWDGFWESLLADSYQMLAFFFWYPLGIPSIGVLVIFMRRRPWPFILASLLVLLMLAVTIYDMKPHYLAPLTCVVVWMVTIGLRALCLLESPQIKIGLILAMVLMAVQLTLNIVLTSTSSQERSWGRLLQASIQVPGSFGREDLKNMLERRGGKYLVIVSYPPKHNILLEWVFNDADIDHAPIVWARDMGPQHNQELLDYFKDRQVLWIDVYRDDPYPGAAYDIRQRWLVF